MPIASGAAGRVDVGVVTNKRWTSDGLKRNGQPVFRQYDSYLLRHQELKLIQNKSNPLQGMRNKTNPTDRESDGAKEEIPQKNRSSDNNALEPTSRGERSKTSKLCVII